MGKFGGCALVALACVPLGLVSGAASAQEVVTQGVVIHAKPATVRKLEYSFDLSSLYDTNVARSSEAIAAARGLHQADFRITPTVGIDMELPMGRDSAYLNGSAGYDFYGRDTRLNGERIDANGGFSRDMNVCTPSLDGSFNRMRTDLGDLNFINNGALTVRDYSNIETTVFGGLSVTCGGEVGFKPMAQIDVTKGYNSNNARAGSDYRTMTYGGGLIYAQPSIGEFGILGSYERTTFDNRDGGADVAFQGIAAFSVDTIGVYANRAVTDHFQARLRINYTNVDAGAGIKAFSGLSGEASVHVIPGGRFRFDGAVSRAAIPALSYTVDYYVETLATASVTAKFAEKLEGSLSYQYRHRKYYSSLANQFLPLLHDNDNQVTASLQYDFRPRLQFILSGTHENRNANGQIYDYHSDRVLFTIRLKR